jgi:hypothetical protein
MRSSATLKVNSVKLKVFFIVMWFSSFKIGNMPLFPHSFLSSKMSRQPGFRDSPPILIIGVPPHVSLFLVFRKKEVSDEQVLDKR